MPSSVRSTLTATRVARRNLTIVLCSATLAVLGIGGGAALALTGGNRHGEHAGQGGKTPTAAKHAEPQQPPAGRDSSGGGQQPQQPPADQDPPGGQQPSGGDGQQQPSGGDQQQTGGSRAVPDVQSVCARRGLGDQIDSQRLTTDDGTPFDLLSFNVNGTLVQLATDTDGTILGAFADSDGDAEVDVGAECGKDTSWSPLS